MFFNKYEQFSNSIELSLKQIIIHKFHADWAINVKSRVLTRFYLSHIGKLTHPVAAMLFNRPEQFLNSTVNGTLTKFHEYWTTIFKVLTMFYYSHNIKKTAPPYGGHVLNNTHTIFICSPDIIRTNVLTKFDEDLTKNAIFRVLNKTTAPPHGLHFHEDQVINVTSELKTARPIGGHVFNRLETFSNTAKNTTEDWTKNVTSRALTRKSAKQLCSHVFDEM
ncbi:hypothetical protein DPMN_180891 [Dreissena polymorpha]|uniref:Uncharacterized protein n=1 Tax=Dreissena polymorpha TaxID=45954 RepID=A0A9D4I3T2_DREPO|nr:hypothetical protein DPMN_180891 [Dreissena polymorpha]